MAIYNLEWVEFLKIGMNFNQLLEVEVINEKNCATIKKEQNDRIIQL